jgi:hypothetical protein
VEYANGTWRKTECMSLDPGRTVGGSSTLSPAFGDHVREPKDWMWWETRGLLGLQRVRVILRICTVTTTISQRYL